MIISNSSPLMYLTKINQLELLKKLFKEIIIPREVYEEVVVRGKEGNFLDALKVEKAISDNWIKVKDVAIDKEIEKFSNEIDLGEISVINLAKRLNADLILIDDASARAIAEILGFKVKGTIYILLESYRKKLINKKEIKDLLFLLISEGFRISSELYAKILDYIEKE